jgi:hypothetical protein
MKNLLKLTMGMTFAISSVITLPATADEYKALDNTCTQEIMRATGIKNPRHIFVISDEGDIGYIEPFGAKPSSVSFPFGVKAIASEPKAITLVPYYGSQSTLACWPDGMGHWICK